MPQVPLNDLSRVDPLIQEQVLGDIGEILRSGSFLKGRFTQALKSNLSHMFGNSSITCVANGTDALFIALSALGVGPGTRVATVANAGGYTTGATLRLGALPVFIDVNPDTAQMSANALRTQLQSDQKVAVVVVTHLSASLERSPKLQKSVKSSTCHWSKIVPNHSGHHLTENLPAHLVSPQLLVSIRPRTWGHSVTPGQ